MTGGRLSRLLFALMVTVWAGMMCGCEEDKSRPGSIGVVGCSLTLGAIDGYNDQGGEALWNDADMQSYNGGGIPGWTVDDRAEERWSDFTKLAGENQPDAVWWMIPTMPPLPAGVPPKKHSLSDMSYESVLLVHSRIKALLPNAEIYVTYSALRAGYTGSQGDVDGQAIVEAHVARLVDEGKARRGPVMTQLPLDQAEADGYHPNEKGIIVWGEDLVDFFGL